MSIFNKKEKKKTNKALWAALIGTAAGVAAGVATGLLLAPEEGKETRQKLLKGANDFTEKAKENLAESAEKVTSATKDLVNKVDNN